MPPWLLLLLPLLLPSTHAQVDDILEYVEILEVKNDEVRISWRVPDEVALPMDRQRLLIAVIRSSNPLSRTSFSVGLDRDQREYTFTGLTGNTTYRTSVEAFQDDVSLWYASNLVTTSLTSLDWLAAPAELALLDCSNTSLEISWTPSSNSGEQAAINQHLVNVFAFSPSTRSFHKRLSINVPVPKSTFTLDHLDPATVYNVTIQSGTAYGYGHMAWSAFATLPSDQPTQALRLTSRSPNAMTLSWPAKWLPSPTSKFTIRAKTLHSVDGIEKELVNTGLLEPGKPSEYVLRGLHPGSTYNITLSTTVEAERGAGRWTAPVTKKTVWTVLSTLPQGEYTVGDPRIVVESDTAASLVFQPLLNLGPVSYQIRHVSSEGGRPVESDELFEADLMCPKFGCEWMCRLVFNLPRRPRDYTFEVRARVDGQWNRWRAAVRRPWTLLERVCSINPPATHVDNIGNEDYQRMLDLPSADRGFMQNPWRYLVVVDSRQADFSSLDLSKLADRATADQDHLPYYITAALTPEQVKRDVEFRLGDGSVHGGYLNYPIRDRRVSPRWTLVPVTQTENEIIEPRLKTCGFTENGSFECDMPFMELLGHIPSWLKIVCVLLFTLFVILLLLTCVYAIRRTCDPKPGTHESSVMYYHNDSPNTLSTTREYRRIENREFLPEQLEERRLFMGMDESFADSGSLSLRSGRLSLPSKASTSSKGRRFRIIK